MNDVVPVQGRTYYARNGDPFLVREVLTSASVIGWLVIIVWADGHVSIRDPDDWPGGPL